MLPFGTLCSQIAPLTSGSSPFLFNKHKCPTFAGTKCPSRKVSTKTKFLTTTLRCGRKTIYTPGQKSYLYNCLKRSQGFNALGHQHSGSFLGPPVRQPKGKAPTSTWFMALGGSTRRLSDSEVRSSSSFSCLTPGNYRLGSAISATSKAGISS